MAAVFSESCSLLALQPHSTQLQVATSRQTIPVETTRAAAGAVHMTIAAMLPPKSDSVRRCTVDERRPVVVTIERAELVTVVVPAERIEADVTREPGHLQQVVVCLGLYYERSVLGVVPVAGVTLLQVEPQLVAVVGCQLTE